MTPEDELLDATAKSILQNLRSKDDTTAMHKQDAAEQDGDDSNGDKEGIDWRRPSASPTPVPTTRSPTSSPTFYPTIRGEAKILKGMMWYDRNANGVRDSNVNVQGWGNDVEYSHGVGGVSVSLVQCDAETGRAATGDIKSIASTATTVTQGFDALMKPQIVRMNDSNGKFRMKLNGLDRYYYVQVDAPEGFLFTSGVCDDSVPGWECDYSIAVDSDGDDNRKLARVVNRGDIKAIGIESGRSTTCVFVDRKGVVQAPINFGIMRVGDTKDLETNVALVLDFDDKHDKSNNRHRQLLEQIVRRATVLDEHDDGVTVTTRYLLGERDKAAIGTVTAEVLASTLDGRLAANGVALDSVDPKDVILSNSRPSSNDAALAFTAAGNQLAVAMEIRGHYSPPPDLDFDYIVQDSINRDTASIRRGLREYNSNCRDQTSKVNNMGLKESDFNAVVSSSGAARPGRGGSSPVIGADLSSMGNVFSTACQSDFLVPDYFETSLQEIEARDLSDVKFESRDAVVFVTEESRSGIDSWAVGPIAAIAGFIILLMGAFVFRRALGPRRVDKYSDALKTKDVDKEEMRRFGEAGGDMDDGSVDSAFYSESDDSDLEETEKERKMRRKRKEKGNDQTRSMRAKKRSARALSGKASRQSSRRLESSRRLQSSSRRLESSSRRLDTTKLVAVSQGSDDTESLGKSSNSSDEVLEKSRERKRAAKGRSEKKLSSSTSSERKLDRQKSLRRGRSKRSGGDNSRIV